MDKKKDKNVVILTGVTESYDWGRDTEVVGIYSDFKDAKNEFIDLASDHIDDRNTLAIKAINNIKKLDSKAFNDLWDGAFDGLIYDDGKTRLILQIKRRKLQ